MDKPVKIKNQGDEYERLSVANEKLLHSIKGNKGNDKKTLLNKDFFFLSKLQTFRVSILLYAKFKQQSLLLTLAFKSERVCNFFFIYFFHGRFCFLLLSILSNYICRFYCLLIVAACSIQNGLINSCLTT